MQKLTLLRQLTLSSATHEDRDPHLSAASGLVRVGNHLYAVADDENHLGVFSAHDHAAPGELLRVLRGDLPDGMKKRKAAKADFEALVALPAFADNPHGALLAIGSGSRANRMNAVLIFLKADGRAHRDDRPPRIIDFAPLFQSLQGEFEDLNIEGAFIETTNTAAYLSLLQRGNKGSGRNARIRVALAPLLDRLASGNASIKSEYVDVLDFSLGAVGGVPLGFTDAASLPGGGFVFTAAAENTLDSYADGACAGAVIGIVNEGDQLCHLSMLDQLIKPEGITAQITNAGLELLVVTDADDASVPAKLFATTIREWR
jgi:hypothetical protein